jgi:N-methylhydantoinase B
VHPARGALGGQAGAGGALGLASGPSLRAKGRQLVPAGERLVVHTPGGGGLGDPARRDAARVERDVRYGLVSAEQAGSAYRHDGAPA